jgi:peptidoglycan/xylan/chitin deacetylase (PgdA/CDA1 family)
VNEVRAGQTLPVNTVAITFDDGYADNLPAARILNRHGVSATFYITAGCLHGDAPFWPSEVRYLVAAARGEELASRRRRTPWCCPWPRRQIGRRASARSTS